MSECALPEKFSWTAKKYNFRVKYKHGKQGLTRGLKYSTWIFAPKILSFFKCLNFQAKFIFLDFRFLDKYKRSSLRSHKWKDQKWMFNYLKMQTEIWSRGEGKFPTLVEVCEGESIKRRVRARGERELFFYEFTMSEILLWIDF